MTPERVFEVPPGARPGKRIGHQFVMISSSGQVVRITGWKRINTTKPEGNESAETERPSHKLLCRYLRQAGWTAFPAHILFVSPRNKRIQEWEWREKKKFICFWPEFCLCLGPLKGGLNKQTTQWPGLDKTVRLFRAPNKTTAGMNSVHSAHLTIIHRAGWYSPRKCGQGHYMTTVLSAGHAVQHFRDFRISEKKHLSVACWKGIVYNASAHYSLWAETNQRRNNSYVVADIDN